MTPSARVETLSPYVARWVRERILQGGELSETAEVRGSRAVLLVADLSGFTTFAEQALKDGDRGAERVQEVLNSCFGRMTDCIEGQGGEVLAFPGDAAIGLWHVRDGESDASAVSAAEASAATILSDLDGSEAPGDFVLRLRVAITLGPVWTALVGGVDGRWESLVGGPAVEQLESTLGRARPGGGVLSPSASAALGLPAYSPVRPKSDAPASTRARAPALGPDAEAALRRFIPRTVQARIDAGQTEWLGEFRRVSVMFVRITGTLDPLADSASLQDVTRRVQEAVFGFGGTVTQFVVDEKGPALLAAWGVAHHAHEDDAGRAIGAGLAIEQALRDLGTSGAIGVATGRVWTGRRGNQSRSEFAMIGDTVNLAARLMQASETTTLCDAETMREAKRLRDFEQMGTIPLKGRTSVRVFRPLGERRPNAQRVPELFGRVAERAAISSAIDALGRGGRGGTIVVSGDAGVGKSHLVAKSIEVAEALGLTIETFTGVAIESSDPYSVARDAIRRRAGLETLPDDDARWESLRNLLPDESETLPLLAEALGIVRPTSEVSESMPPQARAQATRDLLVRLWEKAAGGGPTILVLEDAHWMTSSIWAFTKALRERVGPLLVLIAARPMASPSSAQARAILEGEGTVRLDLDALGPADTAALVCQRLGVDAIPEGVGRLVHEKSEGHPFFAEELAYALRDRGLVELRRGECVLVGDDLAALELPNTVEDVVTSRIDLLSAAEQLTLKVAGVLGREFELGMLAQLHPITSSHAELAEQLDSMARLHLVEQTSGEAAFAFKHAITQQVAYGLLAFAQRRKLHLAAAELLESKIGESVHPPYATLAHHYRHAEEVERTYVYLERAGAHAADDFANAEAVRFFEDALAFEAEHGGCANDEMDAKTRRSSWRRKLGEACSNLGDIDRSVPALREALAELGHRLPTGSTGWILRLASQLARHGGRRLVPEVLRPKHHAVTALETVRSYSLLGANYYVLDQPLPFVVSLFCAVSASERIGPSRERALACADMGNVAGIIPLHKTALRYAQMALEIADQLDEPRTKARIATRTALYLGSVGRFRVEELRGALEIAERIGDDHLWEESATVLSVHHYLRSEFDACHQLGRQVAERARRNRSLLHELWGLSTEATCLLHAADYPGASERARDTIQLLNDDGGPDRDSAIKAHGILAAAQYRMGHIGPAFASAERAADLLSRFGRTGYQLLPGFTAVLDLYLSAWESGHSVAGTASPAERVPPLLKELATFSRRYKVAEPRSRVFAARAMRLGGNPSGAVLEAGRAIEVAERLGMEFDIGLARLEWAQAADGGSSAKALASAREIFERLGARDELLRADGIRAELAPVSEGGPA